jgi:DNA-binding winged helix-turn-helix (wHTH) protein
VINFAQVGLAVPNPEFPRHVRFGEFEADLAAGELYKTGTSEKTLLQDQPLAILRALVARPGEMVRREELFQLLWSGNTNVDFDPSLNKAVNRLRESLGDSAETPQYIETLSRRGYRFIAKVELVQTPRAALCEFGSGRDSWHGSPPAQRLCLRPFCFTISRVLP